MANYLDTINVKTAITDNTKLDLGHTHITSANFLQFNPILCKEMVPGEKCDCNLMTFSRMQPLAVPTFGRANIKERAFFVPFRTIFRGWNDFITDTIHIPGYRNAYVDGADHNDFIQGGIMETGSGLIHTVPLVSNLALMKLFSSSNYVLSGTNYVVSGAGTSTDYDIHMFYGGQGEYRKLTNEGRQVLKIIESLGYKIVWDERNEDKYSALPLLAISKIYLDWYYPTSYAQTGSYLNVAALFNHDDNQTLELTVTNLLDIFGWCTYVNFDSDYFVSAWDQPNSPTVGVYSNFKIYNIDTFGWMRTNNALQYAFDLTSVTNSREGHIWNGSGATVPVDSGGMDAPFIQPYVGILSKANSSASGTSSQTASPISEYVLHSLHALTDYLKRHQLVGARSIDRYLARFGKVLSSEKANRCNYIGSKYIPLQIGDVTSTANTSSSGITSNLGTFGGKGMAYEEDFSFNWSTDEYGYLIVISSIVPAAGIYQGIDRKVLHKSKLSFWTPEFDSLGVQAISMRELYNGYTFVLANANNYYQGFNSEVFGFAPRYGEYKYMNDQLTGDFNVRTLNMNTQSADSAWHLMRSFSDSDFEDPNNSGTYVYSQLKHSLNFLQGLRDHTQFDRIFMYKPTNGYDAADPFTMIYDFEMVSYAPMKSLYDVYEFEDKGKEVKEEANGVKMN